MVYIHLSRNHTYPIILEIWFIYFCQETLPTLLYLRYGLYIFVKKHYLHYYFRDMVYILLSRNVTNPIILQIWFIYFCQETIPTLLYYRYGLYTFVKKRYLPYYIFEIWFIYFCQETLPTLLY